MEKSKKYYYEYEDYENKDCNVTGLAKTILNDPERENITEIIVGAWGEEYEDSCQEILNMFAENSENFSHIESLFIGDMGYEECEVSWIEQANYSKLLKSLKNLKHLKIKGANNLSLGDINHENLESLEIICGGLPKNVLQELSKAKLPNLKKLNLYLGVEWYGFNGSVEDIKNLLTNPDFKHLEYLGLGNSGIQNEVIEAVLELDVVSKLKILDFSNGNMTDTGAKTILENFDKIKHLELLNLEHNFVSDEYALKLKKLPLEIDLSDRCESNGEGEDFPLLTE